LEKIARECSRASVGFPSTNKSRHDNPDQPPSFHAHPTPQPQPRVHRPPPLIGVHALWRCAENMRLHYLVFLLASFTAIARGDDSFEVRSTRTPTRLQQEIISRAPDGWAVAFSEDELVLTLPRAQFLNSINHPLVSEDELWREYSWSGDYILRIWTTQSLEMEQYRILVEARKALRESRVTPERPYYGPYRNETDYFVERSLPLPLCQIGTQSVWFAANDRLGHHWVRPASAQNFRKDIVALLLSKGQKYEDAQQGVAPQSATRSESDSEGGDKPQPESKERPR
jgi:hypothetical protein